MKVLCLVALAWMIPCPAFAKPAGNTAEAQKVRAEKYEIEVRFEPEKSFLHAKAAVTLRVEQKTATIEFELNPRLNILELSDAQGHKLEFRRSGLLGSSKLQVWLAEAAAAEQDIKLTFVYEGVLPPGRLDYITTDGILLRDESRWYPAVDLSAFTQNDLTIRVPVGWEALSSGSLEKDDAAQKKGIYRWVTGAKVSSRSLTANSKPQSKALQWDAGKASVFAPGDSSENLVHEAANILNTFDRILGHYSHSLFQVWRGFPGQQGAIGYSAPNFLVVSEDVIKYHDYPGWAPEFLPHEIAHQWFPIEVTLKRQEDGWLAESLAEYLAWRYLREKEPEQARRMVQRAMRDALAPEPLRPLALGLQLFREPWEVTHATLYQRGMLVWRTLETVIDRERVDLALREYYKRLAGKSASIADFRKICEEISGRDLGWFFTYFLDGTQIPEISLRRIASDVPNVLLGEIVIKNVPADFQVRVEMSVQTAKGAVEHSVATRGEVTPFSLNLPAPATQVGLDPDMRLLRWTEAARRNREQRKLLRKIGDLKDGGELIKAVEISRRAIELDPDDLAANQQVISFIMGRMYYSSDKFAAARREFGRVLDLASFDPMETDFYRAWAHVYRVQMRRGVWQVAGARKEAIEALASKSPAMETKVAWPETPRREVSAREALQEFLRTAK